jgi:hypothetical protein
MDKVILISAAITSLFLLMSCHSPNPNVAIVKSVDSHIKEIDGRQINDFFRKSYELTPGDHSILVVLDKSPHDKHSKPKKRTVDFKAEGGHTYHIYKDEVKDITKKKRMWHEDDYDKP